MNSLHKEQYIEFDVGAETFAIHIEDIHEVIRMLSITDIPFSRHGVKGVVNLRGKVVGIMSLHNLLGMAEELYTRSTRIVVVRYGEEVIGFIVDNVHKVTVYDMIHPAGSEHFHGRENVLQGVARRDDRLVGILKLEGILRSLRK